MKIISLDNEVRLFVVKTIIDLIFVIENNNRNTEINLIEILL